MFLCFNCARDTPVGLQSAHAPDEEVRGSVDNLLSDASFGVLPSRVNDPNSVACPTTSAMNQMAGQKASRELKQAWQRFVAAPSRNREVQSRLLDIFLVKLIVEYQNVPSPVQLT